MGGKSGGGGQNTVVQQSNLPAPVLQAYQTAMNAAQGAASQPLQQYGGPYIAGFTPDQTSAFNTIDQSQGIAQPYINQAQGLIQQGTQPLWSGVQQFSPQAVSQYSNPYTQNVINSTMAQLNQNDAIQQQQLTGNAISSGAWGGDRAGIAKDVLGEQQNLANNQTVAGLNSQGYQQALGEFNTQQQAQLGANQANAYLAQQGAYGLGNLGQEALGTNISGASSQLQAGALQQQLGQEALNIPYEQFTQQQAYPFQTAQYFAGIAEGLGNQGGTSSTTSPGPSMISQLGGLGLGGLGLAGQLGAFSGAGSLGSAAFSNGAVDVAPAFTDALLAAKRGGEIKGYDMGGALPWSAGTSPNIAHDNTAFQYPGEIIGAGIGGFFGGPIGGELGGMAGKNAGYTAGDLFSGNIKGLGLDVSQNLPPGFQDTGWNGLLNGATGLPLSKIGIKIKTGGRVGHYDSGGVTPPDPSVGFIPAISASPGGVSIPAPPKPYQPESTNYLADLKTGEQLGNTMSGAEHMDDGGMVGGIGPTTVPSEGLNPMQQQYYQRFNGMDPQQLQQLVQRMPPGSPMTAMAQRALQQKRMMPNVGVQAQNGFQAPQGLPGLAAGMSGQPTQGYDDGGDVLDEGLSSPPPNTAPPQGYTPGKVDPWQALTTAGFGMMAGTSPFAGVNIGRGALEGEQQLAQQRKQASEETYQTGELGVRQQEAKARALQIAAAMKNMQSEAAHRTAEEGNWASQRDIQQQDVGLRQQEMQMQNARLEHMINQQDRMFNMNAAEKGFQVDANGMPIMPASPTGNPVTPDIRKLDEASLGYRNKTYNPDTGVQSDETAQNLNNVLSKYDLDTQSGKKSEANRYIPFFDLSSVDNGTLSPDDYKTVQGNIGALKSAAMNGAKNVRNLREFQAITSQADLFGGGNESARNNIDMLNAGAHIPDAEHQFYNSYFDKYHTLQGADAVWQQYNKENEPLLTDKNRNPAGVNRSYFDPANINKYVEGAPQIYQKAIGGKQGVPAQQLPTIQGWDPLESTCRHASLSIL